ncbi:hypothetical protein PSP6_180072 [Paraburkholderia tropica]|nr:hypothetical protein PSP6_180072 [Paraburkholderia tropica]
MAEIRWEAIRYCARATKRANGERGPNPKRKKKKPPEGGFFWNYLEARAGVEPAYTALQAAA